MSTRWGQKRIKGGKVRKVRSVRTLSSGEYAAVGDRPTCRKPTKTFIKGGKVRKVRSSVRTLSSGEYAAVGDRPDLPVVNQLKPLLKVEKFEKFVAYEPENKEGETGDNRKDRSILKVEKLVYRS